MFNINIPLNSHYCFGSIIVFHIFISYFQKKVEATNSISQLIYLCQEAFSLISYTFSVYHQTFLLPFARQYSAVYCRNFKMDLRRPGVAEGNILNETIRNIFETFGTPVGKETVDLKILFYYGYQYSSP